MKKMISKMLFTAVGCAIAISSLNTGAEGHLLQLPRQPLRILYPVTQKSQLSTEAQKICEEKLVLRSIGDGGGFQKEVYCKGKPVYDNVYPKPEYQLSNSAIEFPAGYYKDSSEPLGLKYFEGGVVRGKPKEPTRSSSSSSSTDDSSRSGSGSSGGLGCMWLMIIALVVLVFLLVICCDSR